MLSYSRNTVESGRSTYGKVKYQSLKNNTRFDCLQPMLAFTFSLCKFIELTFALKQDNILLF